MFAMEIKNLRLRRHSSYTGQYARKDPPTGGLFEAKIQWVSLQPRSSVNFHFNLVFVPPVFQPRELNNGFGKFRI